MSQSIRKPKHQKRRKTRISHIYGSKHIDQVKIENIVNNDGYKCDACDRIFIDSNSEVSHLKSKKHKLRVKELKMPTYSIKESEQCGGLY